MTNLQLFEAILWALIFLRAVKAYVVPREENRKALANDFKDKSKLYRITFVILWDVLVAGIFFLIALWGKRIVTFF